MIKSIVIDYASPFPALNKDRGKKNIMCKFVDNYFFFFKRGLNKKETFMTNGEEG